MSTPPIVGLWVDDPISDLKKPTYWETLRRLGIRSAAIMIESMKAGFDAKASGTDLEAIRAAARPGTDMHLSLTVWPEPTVAWVTAFERVAPTMIDQLGAAGIELDAEGNWTADNLNGYGSMETAATALNRVLLGMRDRQGVRLELTSFTYHAEMGKRALLSPRMDVLFPQAYSVRNRHEGPVAWDAQLGPGKMQAVTLDRARAVPTISGAPRLGCGLAAYDQTWPNEKPETAMRRAWNVAVSYDLVEVRFWSSKWVVGARKNAYAADFIKTVTGA